MGRRSSVISYFVVIYARAMWYGCRGFFKWCNLRKKMISLRVIRQLLRLIFFCRRKKNINSASVSAVYIHRMHTDLTNYWTENLGCISQMTEQGARTHVLCRYVTCTLNVNRILRIQTFLCRQLSILSIELKNSIIRFMKIRFPIPGIHNVFLCDFALQPADYIN